MDSIVNWDEKEQKTEDEYGDATYDGPKWQQVEAGRRSNPIRSKPEIQGSASERETPAQAAKTQGKRGLVVAAKPRVRERSKQQQHPQPQRRRQLPTQAGVALPLVDIVPGKEDESEAIIAEAHRQATEKLEQLRTAAATAT